MLARLDQAISQFRYAPVPLDKDAVDRGDRLPRMAARREFHFSRHARIQLFRRREERHAEAPRGAGPGHPLRPGRNGVAARHRAATTTPEMRAFLHGPDPLIVTKANAKSVVHRRTYLDYVGVKTFDKKGKLAGELRIVGLFTSTAYTRSVMKIPYLRSKARDRHREVGLRSGRPFRQGADQRARILSARRTLPDRGADAAQAFRGDPRRLSTGHACGRSHASTSSTVSFRF